MILEPQTWPQGWIGRSEAKVLADMPLGISPTEPRFPSGAKAPLWEVKMGLRWWRDVLIRNQTKRYLDDR
jgi:hypothetical protein